MKTPDEIKTNFLWYHNNYPYHCGCDICYFQRKAFSTGVKEGQIKQNLDMNKSFL